MRVTDDRRASSVDARFERLHRVYAQTGRHYTATHTLHQGCVCVCVCANVFVSVEYCTFKSTVSRLIECNLKLKQVCFSWLIDACMYTAVRNDTSDLGMHTAPKKMEGRALVASTLVDVPVSRYGVMVPC